MDIFFVVPANKLKIGLNSFILPTFVRTTAAMFLMNKQKGSLAMEDGAHLWTLHVQRGIVSPEKQGCENSLSIATLSIPNWSTAKRLVSVGPTANISS